MVRKFGPFDTSQFYEVENRRMQRAFNPSTGFVKYGQGQVTAGTGAQLVIAAYPDGALIDGLYVENPATETVTLTTNTASTNPRIDRLVMRLDMTAKTIAPYQIVGTPAASPAVPPLVNTGTVVDMPLCRYQFPGSASAQNPAGIVDERVWLNTDWLDLTITTPATVLGSARCRVLDGVCYFNVGAKAPEAGVWAAGFQVTKFPDGIHPPVEWYISGLYVGSQGVQVTITPDGWAKVATGTSTTGASLTFSGSFPVG